MSFLTHDMSPVDPRDFEPKPGRIATMSDRDPSQLPRSRIQRYNPDTMESLSHNTGRLSSARENHLGTGGIHYDGSHRESPSYSRSAPTTAIPEGPTSILVGVSHYDSTKRSAKLPKFKNVNENPTRKEYIERAREELHSYQRQQNEEFLQRREEERQQRYQPEGYVLEKGFAAAPRTDGRITKYISDEAKYLTRSAPREMPTTVHRKILDPVRQPSPEDDEMRAALRDQIDNTQKRRMEEHEYLTSNTDGLAEMMNRGATNPKARLSHEHTASVSRERNYHSAQERQQRVEELSQYRQTLEHQIMEAKSRNETERLEGYSTFKPITNDDRISLRTATNSASDTGSKITDNDRSSSLYARQTSAEVSMGERLGNSQGNPIIKKYSRDEAETRNRAAEERRKALDTFQREKADMQERLNLQDRELTDSHKNHDFMGPRRTPNPRIKSFENSNSSQNEPEYLREYREKQREEYKRALSGEMYEKQEQRQNYSRQERDEDQRMSSADPWEWSKSSTSQQSKHAHTLGATRRPDQQEVDTYRRDLEQQVTYKSREEEMQAVERDRQIDEHIQNELVNKMGRKQKTTGVGLTSFMKGVVTTDVTAGREKRDHVSNIMTADH